ncbi:putative class v protein [Neofusicoccum parvum UCRNP2]|uniref:chitinase n=1 Tax=Botryosphaeria parva (strain UCR-NP2) TaxID=1287680 RepID=R1E9V6_BOTPV|nr:putative class v protein [Neofusicoccum parvum UCRNP2]
MKKPQSCYVLYLLFFLSFSLPVFSQGCNCDESVCVANCDEKAYCDPGNYTTKFAEVENCPLNVCCSKWGFCGLTEEFCGDKKVTHKTCDKSGGVSRVVGYYESWSSQRSCNTFMPEQIPAGVYTHLNFAFATIDPVTFEVRPASSGDAELYRRLTALKRKDPGLKVFIALGGWTFNDPGPTATTFSDIARSEANQKAFFKSLISFMATYDFDGVDLDWEYPEADDRSGRPEDFANFPKMMANLKKALKGSGGRDGVSITLPASYWYLQHFDIKKLVNSVDFFNMMTYDMHGTWDKGNKWTGAFLNAHTNLTEIEQSMDLLWRNDISPDKVVLGMAFYGRAFTATSPSCLKPGCTFESGAERRPCSNEISVILNSEIVDIMNDKGVKPTLDKDAAVKILTFDDNQWVAYDDADTFQMKADFARKCPSGWTRMLRKDSGARGTEFMVDQTGCGGVGVHQLCCPPSSDQPTCGWYTHNNGKCDSKCPSGSVEVGSNKMYCNNNGYQAACCTTGSDSMKLYNQCSWADAPYCDSGSCSNNEVALSTTGSGGAVCNMRSASMREWSVQERKYCCDNDDDNSKWDDCRWYDNLGWGPADHEGFCRSGCPSDRVRVAMDEYADGCYGGGRSKCCLPKFKTITKRWSTEDEEFSTALAEVVDGVHWMSWAGGSNSVPCACTREDCCDDDDTECIAGEIPKRSLVVGAKEYWLQHHQRKEVLALLEKRTPEKDYPWEFIDALSAVIAGVIRSWAFRSNGDWNRNHQIWNYAYMAPTSTDCLDVDPEIVARTPQSAGTATEHIVEINSIPAFFGFAGAGTLPSGGQMTVGRIAANFFTNTMNALYGTNPAPPAMVGGTQELNPGRRIMNAVGSNSNDAHFVLAQSGFNRMKSSIWRYEDPTALSRMNTLLNDMTHPERVLNRIRMAIAVIHYMNDARVHRYMVAVLHDIREELIRAQDHHFQQTGQRVRVVAAWDEYIRDHLRHIASRTRTWVQTWARNVRNRWATRTDANAEHIVSVANTYYSLAADLEINEDGIDQEPVD